jgi:hypothetical protein
LYISTNMSDVKKYTSTQENITQLSEIERLKRDIFRPDMEKLQLFTKMLRTDMLLKKAVIRHK